jgi:hypothetical protein
MCFLCGLCRGVVEFKLQLVLRHASASKGANTEAEEATELAAVTRQRLMKKKQTEKLIACCGELQNV